MKNLLLLLAFALPLTSWSQATVFGHATFQLPVALGEFRETGDPDLGAGARFNFYLQPSPGFPLQAGIDFGIFGRGRAVETLRLNVAGFEDDYKVRANNGVGNFGFLLKLEPLSGKRFSPYIEGEAGYNVFYSTVYFQKKNRNSDNIPVGKTEETKGRWAPFFGGSAGVKIALGKKPVGGIELKCAWLKGGKTSYNAKPYFTDEGEAIFERRRSNTDLLVPQIGVWVNFREAEKADSEKIKNKSK